MRRSTDVSIAPIEERQTYMAERLSHHTKQEELDRETFMGHLKSLEGKVEGLRAELEAQEDKFSDNIHKLTETVGSLTAILPDLKQLIDLLTGVRWTRRAIFWTIGTVGAVSGVIAFLKNPANWFK